MPADTAGVNVNNLLGSPGEPAATSADFVASVGHDRRPRARAPLGPRARRLVRSDRLGDLRRGQPRPLQSSLSRSHRRRRDSLAHHGLRAPRCNATLFDAINDPFFGEREAIKLAYGENGTPTNEQTTPHYSMADAQPIALGALVVPDTDLEGANADQVFDVTAADVVGDLGLDATALDTDYYSFTARPAP